MSLGTGTRRSTIKLNCNTDRISWGLWPENDDKIYIARAFTHPRMGCPAFGPLFGLNLDRHLSINSLLAIFGKLQHSRMRFGKPKPRHCGFPSPPPVAFAARVAVGVAGVVGD